MSVKTVEGIIRNGKVVIPEEIKLPEAARVYIVVPDPDRPKQVMSPRLVDKSDAQFFEKTVEEDSEDEVR